MKNEPIENLSQEALGVIRSDAKTLIFLAKNSNASHLYLDEMFLKFVHEEHDWYKAAVVFITFADAGCKSYVRKCSLSFKRAFDAKRKRPPKWIKTLINSQELREALA